jgi:hypothetical protein
MLEWRQEDGSHEHRLKGSKDNGCVSQLPVTVTNIQDK